MEWNEEKQTRFNYLRRKLASKLTADEQAELAELIGEIEDEEARYFGPTMARMEIEQAVLQEQLEKVQLENEELAKRIHQLERKKTRLS